jgi:hypothetical protein
MANTTGFDSAFFFQVCSYQDDGDIPFVLHYIYVVLIRQEGVYDNVHVSYGTVYVGVTVRRLA